MVESIISEVHERPDDDRTSTPGRLLYNASTVATLTIGVVVLHAATFVLLVVTAWWTLPTQMLEQSIGHPVGPADKAVKQAAYGARQQQRFERTESTDTSGEAT
jgi:hypothetical protein